MGEPGFPEAQDVLRHVEFIGDFTDGAERVRRLFHSGTPPRAFRKCYLSRGRQASASTRKFSILIGSRGLFPIDPLLQDGGGLEYHHPAGRDRDLGSSLGITPDALTLLADYEGPE